MTPEEFLAQYESSDSAPAPAPTGGGSKTPEAFLAQFEERKKEFGSGRPEEAAMRYIVGRGWKKAAAAGIVGNAMQESGMDPNITGAAGELGLFQHAGDRKNALLKFASDRGEQAPSFKTQLDFMLHELETTEAKAGAALKNANTPQESAVLFSTLYERPGKPMLENRVKYASDLFGREIGADNGSALKDAGTVLSRAAGTALGAANVPHAFVAGLHRPGAENPELYAKMPGWERALTNLGSGFTSAYESAFVPGSWGAGFNDIWKYYSGGEGIEEALPEGWKHYAPTVEFIGSVLTDPVVTVGGAKDILAHAGKKEIFGPLLKSVPDEIIAKWEKAFGTAAPKAADIAELDKQLATASKAEKQGLLQRLHDVVSDYNTGKAFEEVAKPQLPQITEGKEPVLIPEAGRKTQEQLRRELFGIGEGTQFPEAARLPGMEPNIQPGPEIPPEAQRVMDMARAAKEQRATVPPTVEVKLREILPEPVAEAVLGPKVEVPIEAAVPVAKVKDETGVFVVRAEGSGTRAKEAVDNIEAQTREGYVYRGMTEAEFQNTLGKGGTVESRKDFSFSKEGTSFSERFDDAESYVNYGRDDPRATGKPNYIVEVEKRSNLEKNRQGYYEAKEAIPKDQVGRIWKIDANKNELLATEITSPKVTSAKAKEPWEMTREEFFASQGLRSPSGYGKTISGQKIQNADKLRERIVGNALSEGKPIPPEVLADYPDLAKKGASPVKEPWQMTEREFGQTVKDEALNYAEKRLADAKSGVEKPNVFVNGVKSKAALIRLRAEGLDEARKAAPEGFAGDHLAVINKAIREGQVVPEVNLKRYQITSSGEPISPAEEVLAKARAAGEARTAGVEDVLKKAGGEVPTIDTPEFKAWFGDSKVVDEAGKPLVVYHGTQSPEDFTQFKNGLIFVSKNPRIAGAEGGYADPYFLPKSVSPELQQQFISQTRPNARIIPLYARIEKPANLQNVKQAQKVTGKMHQTEPEVIDYLKSQGFDGIMSGNYEYIAFSPEQIKSVFNRGTFDPKDAHLLRGVAGLPAGFQEDDQGNITFDPMAAAAGFALGTVASKNSKWYAETMAKNPEWAKVAGAIGKAGKESSFWSYENWIKQLKDYIDRAQKVKKMTPETYEKIRTYASHKDVASLEVAELDKSLAPVKNDFNTFRDLITAQRMETRAQILKTTPKGEKSWFVENPGGVTLSEARKATDQILAAYEARGGDAGAMIDAADSFNQWTRKNILDPLHEAGIVSDKAYAEIARSNNFYATFDVIDHMPADVDKIPTRLPSKEYFSVANQDVIKGLVGTKKEIADPFEATMSKFLDAKGIIARNKVANTFVDEMLTHPDPNVSLLIRPVADSIKDFKLMQARGENPVMHNAIGRDFDTIARFKGGEVEKYAIPTEYADTMKGLSPGQAPRWMQALNAVFRGAATTYSLAFSMGNAARDFAMAFVTTPFIKPRHIFGKFETAWGRGFAEGLKHEFAKSSKMAEEYFRAGGGMGWSGELRGADKIKSKIFAKSLADQGIAVVKSPMALMEHLSGSIELAPRMGIYNLAKEAGYTPEKGAMFAREGTIDFNKAGTKMRVVNQWVPFLNARVQARVQLWNAFKNDPVNTAAKVATITIVPGIATYAWNRAYYSDLLDDIPEYIRQNYFTIITGSKIDDKTGQRVPKYFVIPKGDVGQMFFNPIEAAFDSLWKKKKFETQKVLTNIVSDVIAPVPIARDGELSAGMALGGLTPPVIKGALQNLTNYNFFTGRAIESPDMLNKPPSLRYRESTPGSYKKIAEVMSNAGVEVSPVKMQDFMSNILAGYGREGLDPQAMLEGITGRFVKSKGGEKENRAWDVYGKAEEGYTYTRARMAKLIEEGDYQEARELAADWNEGLPDMLEQMEDLGFPDKGKMRNAFHFDSDEINRLIRNKSAPDEMSPIEKRLKAVRRK